MILKMLAVYDVKAGAYTQPFFAVSVAFGVRQFFDLLRDPEHMFAKHPRDFSLEYLGDWDDQNAAFGPLDHPQKLGTAFDMVKKAEEEQANA